MNEFATGHRAFMRAALEEARQALADGEVPVGAVIVKDGEIIARAHNMREGLRDPTAHAEMLVIRQAAGQESAWRLDGCTLYVTLEPCPMCAGAIVASRVPRCVIGTADPRAGAAGSVMNVLACHELNHKPEVLQGVLEEECAAVLREFFEARRDTSTL